MNPLLKTPIGHLCNPEQLDPIAKIVGRLDVGWGDRLDALKRDARKVDPGSKGQ